MLLAFNIKNLENDSKDPFLQSPENANITGSWNAESCQQNLRKAHYWMMTCDLSLNLGNAKAFYGSGSSACLLHGSRREILSVRA